jgi:DNA-binding response OmpR family regulator
MSSSKTHIAIVEHSDLIASLIADVLREEGYYVSTIVLPAKNSDVPQPDLFIVDISPPFTEADGAMLYAVCRDKSIPVIVLSTNTSLIAKVIGDCNVVAELEKPFDLAHLLEVVDSSLSGRSKKEEAAPF